MAGGTSREVIRAYLEANEDEYVFDDMRRALIEAGHDADAIELARAELEAEAVGAVERDRQTYIRDRSAAMEEVVSTGRMAFLHTSIYVPVDSVVDEETLGKFEISSLEDLGMAGWEIVTVIPRTVGIGLSNRSVGSTFGKTWGAGIGGNVAGVHVVLRYAVTRDTLESSRKVIERFIGTKYDRLPTPTSRISEYAGGYISAWDRGF